MILGILWELANLETTQQDVGTLFLLHSTVFDGSTSQIGCLCRTHAQIARFKDACDFGCETIMSKTTTGRPCCLAGCENEDAQPIAIPCAKGITFVWGGKIQLLLLMEEIRRSPVEVGNLSHYLLRVLYIPGGSPDFFHQQYHFQSFG